MYLHVGNKKSIRQSHIIGIFDTDNATLSKTSRAFLSLAQKNGAVEAASEDIPKSFILSRENKKNKICFSPLSSSALLGRCESGVRDND